MPALAEVAREKLHALDVNAQRRVLQATRAMGGVRVERGGQSLISFSSNDYLGMAMDARVIEAAREAAARYGAGAGASRLVTGNHPLYASLEARLAAWKGTEAALVFGSGYLANLGIISALMGRGDLVLADRLVHACLIDGARVSGAKLARFAHNDVDDCRRLLAAQRSAHRHCLIVTDEIFSMHGDAAPMEALSVLAREYDAWLLGDGAHSLKPVPGADLKMGTLSKALGSYGGYVCGERDVIDYLTSAARSFIFTTGLPPAVIGAADKALEIVMSEPGLADAPVVKARLFTDLAGLPQAVSPIVPVVLGDEARALAASRQLVDAGYLVSAIRPPTVPEGTSRLRFAFSALHADEDIEAVAGIVRREGWGL